MDAVDHTLKIWRSTPFAWGESDCMLSIGDHIARNGGQDVTGWFRGTYDTKEGALHRMSLSGGVSGLIGMTGIERVQRAPERGDVVALGCGDEDGGAIGALCTGDMIAARLSRGVIELRTGMVRLKGVWRCQRL